MNKPLNLSQLNRPLRLFLWFLAVSFGTSLIGCTMLQRTKTVEEVVVEPTLTEQPSCPDLSVWELEKRAIELLDRGLSQLARTQLKCALEVNPNSNRAMILLEQMNVDPVRYLGSRNYRYTVKSSDTLSKIAQERLGSSLKFVSLARYNDIEVPANLVTGQTIKIPGKDPGQVAPPPIATTPPIESTANDYQDQALVNEEDGNFEEAFELIIKAKNADASLENIEDDYSRIKDSFIAELEEKAYNLELSGSPREAVETWRKVLEIDPGNIQAQLSIKRLSQYEQEQGS